MGKQIDFKKSIARVRAGGIPLRAEERLQEEMAHGGKGPKLFSSDLSVSEFLLARDAKCEPIAMVMGSSIFHVGEIGDYRGATGEVNVISEGHRQSRKQALARLQLEAQLVGADAVIGVIINDRMITMGSRGKGGDDGGEVLEFTVVGTAVKAPWINHEPGKPILTDLSGQELWALHQEGFEPCGFVFDYCRYHVWHVMNPPGCDPEFAKRLQREGGASGDVRISMLWNDRNDLDLHVITPSGEEISFSSKRSRCGGRLDVDANFGERISNTPVENVFWAHGNAPVGRYKVNVKKYNSRDTGTSTFKIEVVSGSTVKHFQQSISGTDYVNVTEFDYDGKPFEITSATRAVDEARGIATRMLSQQAEEHDAEFVIGSDIDVKMREGPCGALGCELNDLDVVITWMGTGVRRIPGPEGQVPRAHPPFYLAMIPLGRRRDADIEGEEDASDIETAAEEAEEAAEEAAEANAPDEDADE